MDNNDLLRRLRYALRCDDAQTSRFIQLGGGSTTTRLAARYRAKDNDPEFTPCDRDVVAHFLDGLILENRGPREVLAPSPWPSRSKNKQTASKSESPNFENSNLESASSDGSQMSGSPVGSSKPTDLAAEETQKAEDFTEPQVQLPQMDNNIVLKQLRIALSLRSDDVHAILQEGGSSMTASEAGALFRKPDARNYRKCGDQVLRQFIAGLVKRREQESQD